MERQTFILDKGWRDLSLSRDSWCIVTTGHHDGWYCLRPQGDSWDVRQEPSLIEALRASTELMMTEPLEWAECGVPFRRVVEDSPEAVLLWLQECRQEMIRDAEKDQWSERLILSSVSYMLGEMYFAEPKFYMGENIATNFHKIQELLEKLLNEREDPSAYA